MLDALLSGMRSALKRGDSSLQDDIKAALQRSTASSARPPAEEDELEILRSHPRPNR